MLQLKGMVLSQNLIDLLRLLNITPCHDSYLGRCIDGVKEKGVTSCRYMNLLSISQAFDNFEGESDNTWLIDMLKGLCSPIEDAEDEINVNSKFAAELIAGGILKGEFEGLKPLSEDKKHKMPDFQLTENCFIEVYCPQESQPEIKKVKKELEKQTSLVKVAISHPITGSNQDALSYPTNKTIDRILNGKRKKDQTKEGYENILWIDLCHGFKSSVIKTLPLESINHGEHTYLGSFGLWHSFYGEAEISNFAPDRTVLKYLEHKFGFYKQKRQGLFRVRTKLSAALILTTDGLVLFENPWAEVAISEGTKLKVKCLFKFRPEFSWFGVGKERLKSRVIDSENKKIDWLFGING